MSPSEKEDRRKFLRQAATIGWATPLILTAGVGRAAAASPPCIGNGAPCNACAGVNCCDEDGPADGGCCCSDANSSDCGGVCVAVDADCALLNTVATDFTCFAPGGPAPGVSQSFGAKVVR